VEDVRSEKLQDFDKEMEQLLHDWNAPGVRVGIVVKDNLILARGYGYRDYEQRLPFTSTTLLPDCIEYQALYGGCNRTARSRRETDMG